MIRPNFTESRRILLNQNFKQLQKTEEKVVLNDDCKVIEADKNQNNNSKVTMPKDLTKLLEAYQVRVCSEQEVIIILEKLNIEYTNENGKIYIYHLFVLLLLYFFRY